MNQVTHLLWSVQPRCHTIILCVERPRMPIRIAQPFLHAENASRYLHLSPRLYASSSCLIQHRLLQQPDLRLRPHSPSIGKARQHEQQLQAQAPTCHRSPTASPCCTTTLPSSPSHTPHLDPPRLHPRGNSPGNIRSRCTLSCQYHNVSCGGSHLHAPRLQW